MTEPTSASPHPQAPMYVPRFLLRQQITMMVNRYELYAADADGTPGPLLALAQQKRMAFKEQVTFYADAARTEPVFSFTARKRIDLGSGYDVHDAAGNPLGSFAKEFGASLLRSTWRLSGPDLQARSQERNHTIAILRRLWDFVPVLGEVWVPFVFHFDFVDT
ncbi:MAG TPA: hypothetical protein VFJ14_02355, partial [Nocardioidaceae bacterium]|nr:hypothetical protein [Nocardioidaceae bacterium]